MLVDFFRRDQTGQLGPSSKVFCCQQLSVFILLHTISMSRTGMLLGDGHDQIQVRLDGFPNGIAPAEGT